MKRFLLFVLLGLSHPTLADCTEAELKDSYVSESITFESKSCKASDIQSLRIGIATFSDIETFPTEGGFQILLNRDIPSNEAWLKLVRAKSEPQAVWLKAQQGEFKAVGKISFTTKPALTKKILVLFMGLIIFIVAMFAIIFKTALCRDMAKNRANVSTYSLSKLIFAYWTTLIIACVWYLTFINEQLPSLPPSIAWILSIGFGTASASQGLNIHRYNTVITEKGSNTQSATISSKGFFSDLFKDHQGVAISRVQILLWNLSVGIYFFYITVNALVLPDFGADVLSLMFASAAGYLGLKLPESKYAPGQITFSNGIDTPIAAKIHTDWQLSSNKHRVLVTQHLQSQLFRYQAIGVSLGEKYRNGLATGQQGITFFVKKKLPVTGAASIPNIINVDGMNYATDVVEFGALQLKSQIEEVRLSSGASSTLGAYASRNGVEGFVGAMHMLVGDNHTALTTSIHGRQPILNVSDSTGTTNRGHFEIGCNDQVDAFFASLESPISYENQILFDQTRKAYELSKDEPARFRGAISKQVDMTVLYPWATIPDSHLSALILTKSAQTVSGDSGGCLYDSYGNLLGFLVGSANGYGVDGTGFDLFTPAHLVEEILEVKFGYKA